jgi:fluoride exporter
MIRLPSPLVVSAGGALGALARYGLCVAFPPAPGRVPWVTIGINVAGCLLIGVLMVLVTEAGVGPPLLRPFLGVGVLGGFTTFSTYAVETWYLTDRAALWYLVGTPVAALAATLVGSRLTRWVVRREERP